MKIAGFAAENMASSHLRVRQWVDAMRRRGHDATFHGDTIRDLATIDNKLAGCDAVIYGRTHDIHRVVALLAARKVHGFKLIVDTDDLVDEVPAYNFASTAFTNATGYIKIAHGQYRDADAVTVSTPYLLERTAPHNEATFLIPNVTDTRLWNGVRMRQKESRHSDDIRICWAGGGGHYNDLLIARDAIMRIVAERPNAKLIFGNFVPAWAAALPWDRVFFVPLVPFEMFPKFLTWLCADIGIAPLVANNFNRAKSHVKYLDYALAGISGVYQDIDAYEPVRDGYSGLKATTPDSWYERLNALIESPELRRTIAANARADVLANMTVENHEADYERILQRVCRKPAVITPLVEGEAIACQMS